MKRGRKKMMEELNEDNKKVREGCTVYWQQYGKRRGCKVVVTYAICILER